MEFKRCILCDKLNSQIYFGICMMCHIKIDKAIGYPIYDVNQVKIESENK